MDWKEKFADCLTAKGNLKRSLTPAQKTEILQYRVRDQYKVLGEFKTNKTKVLCACIKCETPMELEPRYMYDNATPCQSCAGKLKRNVPEGLVPLTLLDKFPEHVSIRGVTEPFRGVYWMDMDKIHRDIFYIVKQKNRDLYAFVTLDLKWFEKMDVVRAQLYARGATEHSSKATAELFNEIPDFELGHETWCGWQHSPTQSWVTKYAAVIKYCLEKKFKSRRYPYLLGADERDIPCYCLTPQDLAELVGIKDIEEILDWEL